jgi:5-methyltetrahydrofolate--homocysteine methyltransferase
MAKISLRERIKSGTLILDGAMGTQLIAAGAAPGQCNDHLNITSEQIVLDVHKAYVEAGSQAIITNTFGANRFTLARHSLADEVREIATAGAKIARRAIGDEGYVLGDIGPTGDFLEPLGTLKADELKEAFAAQATALADGDVDGFIIETMTAIDEAIVAVEAVKSVCELPVFVSLSYDKAGEDFRTMMGVSVEVVVSKIVPLGVDGIGFNCGRASLNNYVNLAAKYAEAVKASGAEVVLLAEPNAGIPELVDDETIYNVAPSDYAEAMEKISEFGFGLLGGCCGTSPEFIRAVAEKLKA